jgi:polysaccharide export outer membrane protein
LKRVYGLVLIVILFSSCKVFYPDRLFKTAKDFPLASADSIKVAKEYVIRPGDLLAIGVFSNNGYELVDVLSRENTSLTSLSYVVKEDGYVLLPMLDSVFISGYTVSDAEKYLIEKYTYYFVNPFVRIEVTNRRVYVFRGRLGATEITLDKENMNLLEVIAKAGGIPPGGLAYKIRILRGQLHNPTVFDVDLSTVEGMMTANLRVEANDIIYISSKLTPNDILVQITPLFTFFSSVVLIATTIITLKSQ